VKVSIVIPVYNVEKYLNECIESTLNQTYNDIEVIAVDDGSTDNSLKILKKYSDRIKIIQQKNGGVSSASNTGIRNSTGEWIKIIGADDVLYPNAIQVLVDAAKTFGKDAKRYIFYTDHEVIDSIGRKIYDFVEPNNNDLSDFQRGVIMLDHNTRCILTCMVHKSVFEHIGYFNEQSELEDWEFWLRCQFFHNCKFFLISKITAKYRIHKFQQTNSARKLSQNYTDSMKQSILDKLEPSLKVKYLLALKDYQKNKYPLKIRILLRFRDLLLKNQKMYYLMLNSKMAHRIHHKIRSSWKQ
jgi:glycosyltransferase involved in cell wall biosynthesis